MTATTLFNLGARKINGTAFTAAEVSAIVHFHAFGFMGTALGGYKQRVQWLLKLQKIGVMEKESMRFTPQGNDIASKLHAESLA